MAAPLSIHGPLGPVQRRLAGIVLGFQIPVLVLGVLAVWGLTSAQNDPRAGLYLALGGALIVLGIVAAATLRRATGVTLGWAVQILMLIGVLIDPLILVVAAIFIALWVLALVQGAKMDRLTEEHARATAHA